MENSIKKVAITGGTHGNELTGVYLINRYKNNPNYVKRENFETFCMHTNLEAIKKCTRYIDKDLNRTFIIDDLNNPDKTDTYEDRRAKEINSILGPKGAKKTNMDFIIDLHSTTSDMGLSIVIDNESPLTWQLAAHLQQIDPRVKIFRWKGDTKEVSFVNSITKEGFAIEVGPIPQGVLRADLFFETDKMIQNSLDFFELYNKNKAPKYDSIEIYDHIKLLDFPRDSEGNLTAMVHPNLQDHGYIKIKKGDPVFVTLDGELINYEEENEVYALFINEAAYYEKGFAMCLTEKKRISL